MKSLLFIFLLLIAFSGCNKEKKKSAPDTCGDGIADTHEACDGEDLVGATCVSLNAGFVGGQLGCTPDCRFDTTRCIPRCEDRCMEGAQGCSEDGFARSICTVQSNGCTDWVEWPCPFTEPFCTMEEGEAVCLEGDCVNECLNRSVRCAPDLGAVHTCVVADTGCTVWEAEPCSGDTWCLSSGPEPVCEDTCFLDCREEGLFCVGQVVHACIPYGQDCFRQLPVEDCREMDTVCRLDGENTAHCEDSLESDDCSTALAVEDLPFAVSMTHFAGDYSDVRTFACNWIRGPERWFRRQMAAGERVVFQAVSDADASWVVLSSCSSTVCMFLQNDTVVGAENLLFEAPADGMYYFALEMNRDSAMPQDVVVTVFEPEMTEVSCTNGLDDDYNGLIDCADPACAGVDGCPELVFQEEFETWPPVGWQVVNDGHPAFSWMSSDSAMVVRPFQKASGRYAMVDSAAPEICVHFDDSLVTPELDFSGRTRVELHFVHNFQNGSWDDFASVEVSTDQGSSWEIMRQYDVFTDSTLPYGGIESLDLSLPAAGEASVLVRFRYFTLTCDKYWLLDSVRFLAGP